MHVDPAVYQQIAEWIHSDQSPVGIDAKKTHIYIIDMLIKIEKRLQKIEQKLSAADE